MPPEKRSRVFPTGNALLYIHHIGDLLGKVRPDVFTHHLEDLTPQGMGSTILPSGVKNAPFE